MNAIIYCNAIPVFADIDPETFNIDPESIRKCITSKTKVIMPVHLYGQVCNMTEIMKIAKEYNLGVLEDCAQCYLGTHNGRYEGTFGDVASWSFENSKHITTGDGGILTCNDEKIGDNLRKDIKGANNLKIDCIFISKGVHRNEFDNFSELNKLLDKYGVKANFFQTELKW